MNEPVLKKALEYEKYFNQNPELRRQYELREMAERDYASGLALAEQRGKQQEKINNAINLLKLGVSPEIVSKGVDLPIDKIIYLKSTL